MTLGLVRAPDQSHWSTSQRWCSGLWRALLQFNRKCDVEQPTFPFLKVLCPMRKQTTSEHPSQAHERAAFASRAFVTSTAADGLAIQAEDGIPERENSCVQMVPCSGEHMHQPLSLRCGEQHSIRVQRHSQRVSCQNFQHPSHLWSQARVPGKDNWIAWRIPRSGIIGESIVDYTNIPFVNLIPDFLITSMAGHYST